MFLKGFICGWIGMAAVVAVVIWGMTPHNRRAAEFSPDTPSYDMGYDHSSC